MANRNFKPGAQTIETGTIKLYGRIPIVAGAIVDQDCRGFSVTTDSGGNFVATLEDDYNELYNLVFTRADNGPGAYRVVSDTVSSGGKTINFLTDNGQGGTHPPQTGTQFVEITLKNSTVKY